MAKFSEIKEFGAIPADTYAAIIEEAELCQGPKGEYIKFTYGVTNSEEYAETKLFKNTSFSPKSLYYTRQELIRIGLDPDWLQTDPENDEIVDKIREECIGTEVSLVVTCEPYTNEDGETKDTNNIKKVLSEGVTSLPF